ncbi:hypothetical protein [Butyrivibrio sp. XBB1001]|uniref:hypothetical protein n=1 Tax=Butyrivibrio sp. XBB1001 TaxID=1280682 RepID=UPI0004229E68|nr:hypothetical protein [Butyrivibrio sp. XBB1001]
MNDKSLKKELEDYMENGDELVFEFPSEFPDIWLYQNRKTRKYTFGLENNLVFANTHESIRLVKNALGAVTRWMIENSYDVTYRLNYFETFSNGISIERQYDTIEEAYAAFRVLALGFIVNARDTAAEEDKNKKTIDNIVFRYKPSCEEWVATCDKPFVFEMADKDIVKLAEKVWKIIPEMEEIERATTERTICEDLNGSDIS